jgi:hypothetical protein
LIFSRDFQAVSNVQYNSAFDNNISGALVSAVFSCSYLPEKV